MSPSCVIIENPSIYSSQNRDLRCICTHPRPLSSLGQGPLREPSDKGILMLESVIRGGWLAISGRGSGSHVAMSGSVTLGVSVLVIRTSERFPPHVSSSRLASFSVWKGACPVSIVLKFLFICCHRESSLGRSQTNRLVF